ncbi:multiple C2 and transmembrane domain-containing protein 2 isoform X2 [Corythoichthys intestinalis]|uniref:multiple C2 and transmembrane domain-containing protein 2 isoform X2 n=1 Tax=Corythoichthys intestinalis TaxID=161448 RepID=UPI0025A61461|nr:multiple C2 and transmembrane domain-containing protein 2 isoform X2 [Corythoichthys intestinalis]
MEQNPHKMEVKKKKLLENICMKTKLIKLIKPGKNAADKQKKKLEIRRSISVPDLRPEEDNGLAAKSALPKMSEATFFGNLHLSDSDSIASSSIAESSISSDKEISFRVPVDPSTFHTPYLSEEVNSVLQSNMEKKENISVNWQPKRKGPIINLDPLPKQRTVFTRPHSSSPRPDSPMSTERSWTSEATPALITQALARANSMGEQTYVNSHQKAVHFKQDRPPSEKGSMSEHRENTPLTLDCLGKPVDSADGCSEYCLSGEDQVAMPWLTDTEGLDPDVVLSSITNDCSIEESSLEGVTQDEIEMSSEPCEYFDEVLSEQLENTILTAGPDVQVPAPLQRYLLCISLKHGQNLVIRDKRGTSDPYVKFKLEGKQFYKSKVVYKNLNPRWNEFFSYPLKDREHIVDVRVYDKNLTTDEFMGSSTIPLKNLELYKTYEMELPLTDPKSKEDDMGVICVDVCLMFRDATIKRNWKWPAKKTKATQYLSPAEMQRSHSKSRLWTGALAITLVEGQDLPQYGHGDIYVRFRLGDQKYKSKNLCIQPNPQWRERFDFNQFADNQEPLQVEVFSKRGRKGEESWGMFEVDLSRLVLNERQLYTHMLDPGKGRLVILVTLLPCWGVSVSDIEAAPLEKPDERDSVVEKFSLSNSYKCMGEIGFLQVKVLKANDLSATDLNGKSNPYCVISLGNGNLQTHTIYKTVNPEWNKALTFPIKDIHDAVELTILDENGDKTRNFLGKVAIPLLTVQNEQQICLYLKKEDLSGPAKGTITLVLEVIYNNVRAGIRSFQPKEEKFTEENVKFSKKVLAHNIYRVRKISTAVLYTLQYIKSCFQWENTLRSLIAFLIFLVTVWHWELFMLPLFLLLLICWNYFQLYGRNSNSNQELVNMNMGEDEEDDEKESGKKGLMDKIHMVQEVVLTVQNILEELANMGERTKNLFNWSVPFMSCLACLVLFAATLLLYLIPLRYIVLIWGVHKFTKKLRNPYAIDNNELLDFLKRMPSDVQKVQYSALRAPTSQNLPRKKK